MAEFGGKGLFTKELETALLSGDIDMAVHSMKDVPTASQDGLKIAAILKREDPRDAFISVKAKSLQTLPKNAVVGTASLRRRAQLSAIRPDVKFVLLRGNVGTRLEKLAAGDCDATFLAYAGLKRLERLDAVTEIVDSRMMLNAPAQGAIGVEIRKDDEHTQAAVFELIHTDTAWLIEAERAFLKALDGSCRTPIAALAVWDNCSIDFQGQVLSLDGRYEVTRRVVMTVNNFDEARHLGRTVGEDIRAEIGDRNIWDA